MGFVIGVGNNLFVQLLLEMIAGFCLSLNIEDQQQLWTAS